DPLLISEEVALIVTELGKKGVHDVARIVVDDSAFALEGPVPGAAGSDNPYDAQVGAVAVNFNAVAIRIDGKGGVISAEKQTPTVPLMASLSKGYPPGEHRLNICRTEERSAEVMARYTAELFFAFLRQRGMTTSSRWERGRKSAQARLAYHHESTRKLSGVVELCLQYSSNFIANLLFLAAGAERYGYPATWEKGRRAVGETLAELLGAEVMRGIHLVEGSGLSRENMISVEALLEVLRLFKPHALLLPGKMGMLIKSGTMHDVYGYAGYLDQGESAVVILLNQAENTRDALLDRLRFRSKDH
ncbi:MAG: D-alanyl-D-alanine carboxypeptidase, partial [Desulfobulbaceae bacterium]|nr:D-alanyl-D-alanine carboxypeptidase [Desulfobulbaceae bacterium]